MTFGAHFLDAVESPAPASRSPCSARSAAHALRSAAYVSPGDLVSGGVGEKSGGVVDLGLPSHLHRSAGFRL